MMFTINNENLPQGQVLFNIFNQILQGINNHAAII